MYSLYWHQNLLFMKKLLQRKNVQINKKEQSFKILSKLWHNVIQNIHLDH